MSQQPPWPCPGRRNRCWPSRIERAGAADSRSRSSWGASRVNDSAPGRSRHLRGGRSRRRTTVVTGNRLRPVAGGGAIVGASLDRHTAPQGIRFRFSVRSIALSIRATDGEQQFPFARPSMLGELGGTDGIS